MTQEPTVLEALSTELGSLVEALKPATQKGSAGREFVNGIQRDLYVLDQACRQGGAEGDHAAFVLPFIDTAVAKLGLGQRLFPDAQAQLQEASHKLESLRGRSDLLANLRQAAVGLLREHFAGLSDEARTLLERGGVIEALKSPELLRGAPGAGPPELALAGRLLEALGVEQALQAEARQGPIAAFANKLEGFLEAQGASLQRLEPGQPAPADARALEAPQRLPGLPKGTVQHTYSAGAQLGGASLARAVVVTSPGAATHLAAAVDALLGEVPEGQRTLVAPRVRALGEALVARIDDAHATLQHKAEAALDLVEAVRPLVEADQSRLGPLLEALAQDLGGQEAALILPTPGAPMAPDSGWQGVDFFSREVPANHIVSLLRPGLRLGSEVVRPALVQVSQGEPPPGPLDEVLELLPQDDPRGAHLAERLDRARCLAAGDAGATLARELCDLALFMRDDVLMEPAQKALRMVLEEPPLKLAEVSGWEAVREFLDEHFETLLEEGESGELSAFRLVRPYFQGLRTGELSGARLRALGEAMTPLLSLFDEMMAETARSWLFSELERLGGEGFQPGGHTRRLVRTAAKAIKNFYANQELTSALELTQALTRSGLMVYPEDGERLELCPDPEGLFHRLEAVYDDAPRGKVLGEFEPAVAAGKGQNGAQPQRVRETGAITLSLGPEPAVLGYLKGDELRSSRLGPASARLAEELRELDRRRLIGELEGDAGADAEFARDVAALVIGALEESGWKRADEERRTLAPLFELLGETLNVEILPGYLSYRRLRELNDRYGEAGVKVEVIREGARQIELPAIGAVYRGDLLRPLDMRWCTGPPPAYVEHLRKIPWFDAVLSGQEPGIEITPGAREAILDFDSPDAQSLDGVVGAMSTVVTWLATDHPHELASFQDVVKNAPGLELTFFPLPAHVYSQTRLLEALDRADTPDAIEVVRDAGREDGSTITVDRIAVYQKGKRLSEEPRGRFSLKTLPRPCEALLEVLQPILSSNNVTQPVKATLKGFTTRLALIPEGEGQQQVELEVFKALLAARLVDPTYPSEPENALHAAASYLSGRLESYGVLAIERFAGKKTIDEALAGQPEGAAEIDELFCLAGSAELAEVKRPMVTLEGQIIQQGFLMRGVPTSNMEVLELDRVLVDSRDRIKLWLDGTGALVDRILDGKQKQVLPRTIKRIEDTRKKMFTAQKKGKEDKVLPVDTQRRDLVRFIVDQVHRAEDGLAMLEDKTYRGAFGELVFKDVVFRSAAPYLSKGWNISVDTSVVAGADTQALVGKFKKETGGPKPKRENMKVYSVVLPCYAQNGVTIRPATVRVGDY